MDFLTAERSAPLNGLFKAMNVYVLLKAKNCQAVDNVFRLLWCL